MNKQILWVMFLLASCGKDTTLNRNCPEYCYKGKAIEKLTKSEYKDFKRLFKGNCNPGVPTCDEDFNIITCDNEIHPDKEICDNVDNDCDGEVDEDLMASKSFFNDKYPDLRYPCLRLGECEMSLVDCQNGQPECVYFSNEIELPSETSCDGLDNDCDGVTDEDTLSWLSPTERFCYSGNPLETATMLPCHPGILTCSEGVITCINEMVPSTEICDGLDNDCNGVVDDAEAVEYGKYDIVISIDTSGSMDNTIGAVITALSQYVAQFEGNQDVRFALVILSALDFYNPVWAWQDFTDISIIISRLNQLPLGGASEASLDSVYLICDVSNNPLSLSWSQNSAKIVLQFTDELPQTYMDPPTSVTTASDICKANAVTVYQWTEDPSYFRAMSTNTNGKHYDLTDVWQDIYDNLNEIVQTFCIF